MTAQVSGSTIYCKSSVLYHSSSWVQRLIHANYIQFPPREWLAGS